MEFTAYVECGFSGILVWNLRCVFFVDFSFRSFTFAFV